MSMMVMTMAWRTKRMRIYGFYQLTLDVAVYVVDAIDYILVTTMRLITIRVN